MINKLREKAKAYLADANPSYSKEVEKDMPEVTYWMADFAAECIAAERERADRLHAKLVEIERCYLESGTECSSCYDLFTIAVLAQEAK